MKKTVAALSALWILMISVLAGAEEQPYVVAAVLPLSGPVAAMGQYALRGVQMAIDEIRGDNHDRMRLLIEDDQFDSKRTVAAFHKAAGQDGARAVLVFGSRAGNVVAPLAEQSGVILIAVGASDERVAAGRRFVFTHWVHPEAEAKLAIAEIKRRGYRRIALIEQEDEGLLRLSSAFHKILEAEGLKSSLVFQQRALPDQSEFRIEIAKIRARGADAVYLNLFPAAAAVFAREVRSSGPKIPLFSMEMFEDEDAVRASAGALRGAWFVSHAHASPAFREAHLARYKAAPGITASNAYDTLKLLDRSIAASAGRNAAIAEFLRSVKNYSGACGTYSATRDNGFLLPATVKEIAPDGFRELQAGRE